MFPRILLSSFSSMVISDNSLPCLFCGIFVWFWYQGDVGLIEYVQIFPSSAIFWKYLSGIGISSSLNFW